ncbi:MAG: hypothetical protein KAQ79_17210 [Cyclobacteriaceae bacterium]|nr:hypothetical protein [Cyclobacteriaceae bacterium]
MLSRFIFFTLVFLLISFNYIFAQVEVYSRQIVNLRDEVYLKTRLDNENADIEGSPYYNDSFLLGSLKYKKGQLFEDVALRFHIYLNEVEFKDGNNIYAISNNIHIDWVEIGGDTLVYEKINEDNTSSYSYCKLLVNGYSSLLKKMTVELLDAEVSAAMTASKPERFKRMPDKYYMKFQDEQSQYIGNIKKFVKYLEPKKAELTKYIKQEKISSRNESELKKFVNYYNQMNFSEF